MQRLKIDLGERSYQILIAWQAWSQLPELLAETGLGPRLIFVSNPTVWDLFGPSLKRRLEQACYRVEVLLVEDAEEAKKLSTLAALYDQALGLRVDRKTAVLALGGGVVGDLAGFFAATLLRGLPWVQLPTTLLAQVDSSVGGKVGINHSQGKNLIGSFYQPSLVVADTSSLTTLPRREIRAGLAEVIKYGVIAGGGMWTFLMQYLEQIIDLGEETIDEAVRRSCAIKAQIVAADERESGLRAVLNFGHSLGHAVEKVAGFGAYRHGEAVAIGMNVEGRLAVNLKLFRAQDHRDLQALLRRAGLPLIPAEEFGSRELIDAMAGDKKNLGGRLNLALPHRLGKVQLCPDVPRESIAEAWRQCRAELADGYR